MTHDIDPPGAGPDLAMEPWVDAPELFARAKQVQLAEGPDDAAQARMLALLMTDLQAPASALPARAARWVRYAVPLACGIGIGVATWMLRLPAGTPARTSAVAVERAECEPNPDSQTDSLPTDSSAVVPDAPASLEPSPVPAPSTRLPPASRVRAPQARVEAVELAVPPEAPAAVEQNVADVPSELLLLARARRIMPANPARALELAEEHRSLHPSGVLTEERELLAIEALLRLQRKDEAEQRGRAFSDAFQSSVHAPRVRALLEEGAF
ncbi:MAG: hypothetical protein QM778_28100 [Myxococcales bacterium]